MNSPQNQGGLPPKIWFECWNIMPHTHQEDVKRFPITSWGFLEKARWLPSSSKNKLEKAGEIHVLERSTWLHLLNIIKIWSFLVFRICSQVEGSSRGFGLPTGAKGKNTCTFLSVCPGVVCPGVEQKVKKGRVRLKSCQQPNIFKKGITLLQKPLIYISNSSSYLDNGEKLFLTPSKMLLWTQQIIFKFRSSLKGDKITSFHS